MLVLVCWCLALASLVSAESACDHPESPLLSLCEGCPPTFDGLLCASTTWYNDLTKVSSSHHEANMAVK